MNNSEKYVQPEKARELFKAMRDVVDGKVPVPETPENLTEVKILPKVKSDPEVARPKEFQNGMSAMAEWQNEQERKEGEKREAA